MIQQYRQQSRCWWRVLSVFANPGLWIYIAECALSLLPQTPSFVSFLHLNLIANFGCCHSSRLVGDRGLVFLFFDFYLSFAFLLYPNVSPLYLSPAGPAHIEASAIRIVLSRTVFSLPHNLHLNETQLAEAAVVLVSQPHADEEIPTPIRFFRTTFF